MIRVLSYLGVLFSVAIVDVDVVSSSQKEDFHFKHRAVYKLTYLLDSLDSNSQKTVMTELLLGDEVSLFRSFQKAHLDSLYLDFHNNKVLQIPPPQIIPMGEINAFNYQIVKWYSSGESKVYDEYSGENIAKIMEINFYVESEEAMSGWDLKGDTMTVEGQLCQRADIDFGGRQWTAWFSPELSVFQDGPYKFRGLPGLILKVHDVEKTWDFELVALAKVDTVISINFKEGVRFKEKAKRIIYKDRRNFQKNFLEIQEAAGRKFGSSRPSAERALEDYIKHDNNWIELIP